MRTATVLLLAILASPVAAADLPRDEGARIEAVADGVYVIIHDDATDEWPHANSGVVVGAREVLVVDTPYLPSRARADIALIRKLTPLPVRWLVYTHWHMDHNNGAIAYRQAYPGVTIVAERNSARWTVLNQRWYARMSSAPDSARRQALAEMRRRLDADVDAAGKPLADPAREELAKRVVQREGELRELAELEVVEPDLRFDGTLTLPFDGGSVELVDHGPGNSPHDVTIRLPRAKVLFAGDILVQSPLPYTGASWPVAWIDVLREIEAIPATRIVPGHGPVQADHAYTRAVRDLLQAAVDGVREALDDGLTLEQAQQRIDLSGVRAKVPAWRDPSLDADFRTISDVLVERAWRGVRGQG
jgi:glyoxylase-like metal-dependent hydrolase (beta-lactamase superfamily II)